MNKRLEQDSSLLYLFLELSKNLLTPPSFCYILFLVKIICCITEKGENEMYQQAYECYTTICQRYGMESINFQEFITYLTEEQLMAYSNLQQ